MNLYILSEDYGNVGVKAYKEFQLAVTKLYKISDRFDGRMKDIERFESDHNGELVNVSDANLNKISDALQYLELAKNAVIDAYDEAVDDISKMPIK